MVLGATQLVKFYFSLGWHLVLVRNKNNFRELAKICASRQLILPVIVHDSLPVLCQGESPKFEGFFFLSLLFLLLLSFFFSFTVLSLLVGITI